MKTEISKIEYEIEHLAHAFGWKELPPPNDYTISFVHSDFPIYRVNIYFTKMTVQIQKIENRYDSGEVFKNVSMEKLEEIFQTYGSELV